MVYQYLGGEEEGDQKGMQFVTNPYKDIPPPEMGAGAAPSPIPAAPAPQLPSTENLVASVAAPPAMTPVQAAAQLPPAGIPSHAVSSLDFIKPLPSAPVP